MRKALAILFISFLISILIFLAIILVPSFMPGVSKVKVPYDKYLAYDSHKLMFSLMRKIGYIITVREYDYNKDLHGCIVLLDEWNEKSFKRFSGWFGKNRRLIIFVGTGGISDPQELLPGEIKVNGKSPFLEGVNSLEVFNGSGPSLEGIYEPQGMSKIEPVIIKGSSVILADASFKGCGIVFIGDDRIFSDKILLMKDNAVLLNNLFKDYFHTPIAFDQTRGTAGVPQVKEIKIENFIAKSNFPYLFIQICLLALMFFLVNFKRFGNVLDYNKYKKRSMTNHLEAVGNFFSNSRNISSIAGIFDDYFFEKLSRFFPGRNQEELLDTLAKRYGDAVGSEIFKRGHGRNTAKIEEKRRIFIKIIEKGE